VNDKQMPPLITMLCLDTSLGQFGGSLWFLQSYCILSVIFPIVMHLSPTTLKIPSKRLIFGCFVLMLGAQELTKFLPHTSFLIASYVHPIAIATIFPYCARTLVYVAPRAPEKKKPWMALLLWVVFAVADTMSFHPTPYLMAHRRLGELLGIFFPNQALRRYLALLAAPQLLALPGNETNVARFCQSLDKYVFHAYVWRELSSGLAQNTFHRAEFQVSYSCLAIFINLTFAAGSFWISRPLIYAVQALHRVRVNPVYTTAELL